MDDPRIIAQKLGSDVCVAKFLDGPNLHFAHNIFVSLKFSKRGNC